MKSMNLVAVLSFMLITSMANAALVIDYTGSRDEGETLAQGPGSPVVQKASKTLLFDNSVEWATVIGTCENIRMSSGVDQLSLASALKIFLPAGWKVYANDDLSFEGLTLSWKAGDLWTSVIAESAKNQKFTATIDCASKTLSLSTAPNLGVLAGTNGDFDVIPLNEQNSMIGTQSQSKFPVVRSAPGETISPNLKESIQSYSDRVAMSSGYSRVAYRIVDQPINNLLRSPIEKNPDTPFDFNRAYASYGLTTLNGTDAITGETVMIVTNDSAVTGHGNVFVFPVVAGMLSENAMEVARVLGWNLQGSEAAHDASQIWPLDVDYRVPFSFDIVYTEPVDAFSQLFARYPVQGQLILASKSVHVVKRNTPNRE